MENKINEYFKLQEEIFNHCGYKEDWRIYPLVDNRDYLWFVDEDGEELSTAENMKGFITGDCYSDEILHDRFLPKSIYEGEKYTMILVDTHCDGNKYLSLLSNDKKICEEDIDEEE